MKLVIVTPEGVAGLGQPFALSVVPDIQEADIVITEDGRILKDNTGILEVEKV